MGPKEVIPAAPELVQRAGTAQPVQVPDPPTPVDEVEEVLPSAGYLSTW